MPKPRKIRPQDEAEFAAAWRDVSVTVAEVAWRYRMGERAVYYWARRLGLGYRMPTLERVGLPPFGPRKERAA